MRIIPAVMLKEILLVGVMVLFFSLVLAGCSEEQKIQSPDEVVCGADNLGEQIYDGCNWCTCREYNDAYECTCTERACDVNP